MRIAVFSMLYLAVAIAATIALGGTLFPVDKKRPMSIYPLPTWSDDYVQDLCQLYRVCHPANPAQKLWWDATRNVNCSNVICLVRQFAFLPR